MMRNLFVLLISVLVFNFYGCSSSPKKIKLAAVYNLQGFQADLDQPSLRGAQLAIDQINQNGGLLGRQVDLDVIDGESRTLTIALKTSKYLKDNTDASAMFGLSDTDMVLAAAPLAAKHEHLFLTSGATSPRLPEQIPNYLYMTCFGDNVQAAVAAEWSHAKLQARTATIIYNEKFAYTKLLQGYFTTRFKQLGGDINAVVAYDSAKFNAHTFLNTAHADIVFLAAEGPQDAVKLVKTLRKAGFEEPIVGGDGFDSDTVWAQHPELDNIFFTSHVYLGANNPNPEVKKFRDAFIDKFPDQEPDAFSALGYDSVGLLKTAIENAHSDMPYQVLQAFSQIKNFPGVTGTISYLNKQQIPLKSVTLLAVEDGKIKWVEQKMPEQIPNP